MPFLLFFLPLSLAFSNISFFLYFLLRAPFFRFSFSLSSLSFLAPPFARCSFANQLRSARRLFFSTGRNPDENRGGFSSRHRVTLYPPRYIYLPCDSLSVRMNNKIMPTSTAAWSRCDIGTFSTMIHPEFHPSNMRGNCAIRRQIFLAIGTRWITKDDRAGNTVNEHVSSDSASFVIQHTSSRSRVNSSKDWKIYFGRKRFQALDNF